MRFHLRTYGVGLAIALSVLMAPAAVQARELETVLQDDAQLLHRPEDQLRRSLQEMRVLGVDRIRVTAGWSVLTRNPDSKIRPVGFDATNPDAYEQDRWRTLDRLLILAKEYGFKTMIDIGFWAPKWASDDGTGERGRTNVDAHEFSQFAVAVARRYSGSYVLPGAPEVRRSPLAGEDERFLREGFGSTNPLGELSLHSRLGLTMLPTDTSVEGYLYGGEGSTSRPLPKVDLFTVWNEPNHTGFLRPQWVTVGKRIVPRSPHIYRRMVHFTYPAIKHVRPEATVLVGGTAAFGAYQNKAAGGVPPLRFLRELACVDDAFKPIKSGECRGFHMIPGDGWAHHPYTMETVPAAHSSAGRPDDVPLADLPKLHAAIRQLVKMRRVSPGLLDLWITEYGYETNPPDLDEKYSTGDQARFLTWGEYLTWRLPYTKSFAQFLLRDLPPQAFRVGTSKKRPFGQWQSGLLFTDGTPKLAAEYSFRAGLFVERLRNDRLRLWGRFRTGGGVTRVVVETRRAGSKVWSPMRSRAGGERRASVEFSVSEAGVLHRFARQVDSDESRKYRLRYVEGGQWRHSFPVRAVTGE